MNASIVVFIYSYYPVSVDSVFGGHYDARIYNGAGGH